MAPGSSLGRRRQFTVACASCGSALSACPPVSRVATQVVRSCALKRVMRDRRFAAEVSIGSVAVARMSRAIRRSDACFDRLQLSFDQFDAAFQFVERSQTALQDFDVGLLNAARFLVRRIFRRAKRLRAPRIPSRLFLQTRRSSARISRNCGADRSRFPSADSTRALSTRAFRMRAGAAVATKPSISSLPEEPRYLRWKTGRSRRSSRVRQAA